MVMISLVRRVFACRKSEEVVLGEQIGQTTVVCDDSRADARVASDLDYVDFLVKEACNINVEWIVLAKAQRPRIRTDRQDKERHCEDEEQD